MKLIKFDFTCAKQVPFYAHLCNEYLKKDSLNISVGEQDNGYFIEAEGEQPELEKLADEIAADFLLSIWLTDSKVALVEKRQGKASPIKTAALEQAFCSKCFPLFADNQSSQFGQLDLACNCCNGQNTVAETAQKLSLNDLKALVETLQQDGEVTFNGIKLSLNATAGDNERNKVLVCNPNTLNAHFVVKDHQVLALSSIEKPLITARPIHEHTQLDAPLYDICFAYDRVTAVLAEILRQKGVDWVYYTAVAPRPRIAWIENGWSEIHTPIAESVEFSTKQEPLHDDAVFAGLEAKWKKGKITFTQANTSSNLARSTAATCALHAANLEQNIVKNSAVLYLSKKFPGQIVTINSKKETELFFALPELPSTGYDIYHQLEQSPQRNVLEKFKTKYPEDYTRLLDLKLEGPTDNLQSLWAIAGLLLGLPAKALTKNALADALLASAQSHKGANAPRIDYPLTKGEAHRSLNWCKTLGTVMSFRLADDSDPAKIAFGMQDSLADFISNWIEHVDQNVGIKTVYLAGSEFTNEILARRISLRLGKNFGLEINRELAIDGNNLSTGALYLKQRRR